MKNFLAFILPLVIFIIFANLFVSIKNKQLLQGVCTYQYSLSLIAGGETAPAQINKWQYSSCLYRESFKKMLDWNGYCRQIVKPPCLVTDNDTMLCQALIRKKMVTNTQQDCELDFACPDLLTDYRELIQQCQ